MLNLKMTFYFKIISARRPSPPWQILCVLFVCLTVHPLSAAPASPPVNTVHGIITDALGRPLSDALVELVNASGQVTAQATTNKQGAFELKPTEEGSYSLKASKAGFKPITENISFPDVAGAISIVLPAEEEELVVHVARSRPSGPGVTTGGTTQYTVSQEDIANKPAGEQSSVTDLLTQMPGVAVDQNQQIHIRNTEGPQFQYQINGVLVPLDINTNPPFISMINPMFIKRLDLQTGVLPSRYSYATGGVVDIETKSGNEQPGGSFTLLGGQRATVQPSFQYGGGDDKFNYYMSGLYNQGNTAFSSATPGPNAIHNWTSQWQGFSMFQTMVDKTTRLSLIAAATDSTNQLPNVPGLTPAFTLAGTGAYPSAKINSYLNFKDLLTILALNGTCGDDVKWQVAYAHHAISQQFVPDKTGELIFQGVASAASHNDLDNTLQGDVSWTLKSHVLSAGLYLGQYNVAANDSSLAFPTGANGMQSSATPMGLGSSARAANVVGGLYVNDVWKFDDSWRANFGVRGDFLTGFTNSSQISPTVNLIYTPANDTTIHAGFARYLQIPIFQGISPSAPAAFASTTAAVGTPGGTAPLVERDSYWDVGMLHRFDSHFSLSEDNYYELTNHYLDTGQFGVVPIFAPFNYNHGYIWGSELALNYRNRDFSAYTNFTVGQNLQQGVTSGQFNFPANELAFINNNYIVLDHQPQVAASCGAAYTCKPWTFSLDAVYSSGLRAGFADTERLPSTLQVNLGVQRTFGQVVNRLTILNLLDRTNLIRPAQGIGIFQSAYGPRFTLFDSVTIPFH